MTDRVSGSTIPSSTQDIVVVFAPRSITQAFDNPAPKVAHNPSYQAYETISNRTGDERNCNEPVACTSA